MFDENGNPIAQGPQAGAESPDAQSVSPGVQARIDELTREKNEERRRAEDMREQINSLLLAQMNQSRQVQPEPQVEIDPEERRRITAAVSPEMKAMQQKMAAMEATIQQQQFQQFQSQVPPEVLKEAQALQATWRQGGYTGWTPQDAIVYAQGQAAMRQAQAGQARQQQQFYNQAANNVNMQQGFAPAPSGNTLRMPDFSNLSPSQALEARERWFAQNADKLDDQW